MDPQLRMLLEVTQEAIVDSGMRNSAKPPANALLLPT